MFLKKLNEFDYEFVKLDVVIASHYRKEVGNVLVSIKQCYQLLSRSVLKLTFDPWRFEIDIALLFTYQTER